MQSFVQAIVLHSPCQVGLSYSNSMTLLPTTKKMDIYMISIYCMLHRFLSLPLLSWISVIWYFHHLLVSLVGISRIEDLVNVVNC